MTTKQSTDMLQRITRVINVLNIIGFLWIILSWIWAANMGRFYTYGGLYLFFSTWGLECILEQRWKGWKWDRRKTYFCLMCALFLLGVIYAPWDTTTYFQSRLEHRLGLIGFGLVGLVGLNRYYSLKATFYYMIALAMVMIGFLICTIGVDEFIHNPMRASLLTDARIQYINAHMQFDFFLNVCIVGVWYLLFRTQKKPQWWMCVLLIVCLLCIAGIVLMSEGRSGYISSIMVIGSLVCVETWRWRKWLGIVMIAMAMTVGGYGIMHHQRMSKDKIRDVRIDLWHSSWELIQERPILGYGMSRAQEQFRQVVGKYTGEAYCQLWKDQLDYVDAHNQYLQITMEFGIIGLLLLLAVYFVPIIIDNKHRLLCVYLMGLCMFQSVFDMFIVSSFCLIFGVLVCMLLLMPEACCQKSAQCQHLS